MKMLSLLVLCACAALSACTPTVVADFQVVSNPALVRQAEANITSKLRDPESARFRDAYVANTTLVRDGVTKTATVVCGYVNGKNGFGGYVGFEPYGVIFENNILMQAQVGAGALFDCRRVGFQA